MNTAQFVVMLSLVAASLAEGKTAEELAILSSILVQLGDTLATIAAAQALEPKQQSTTVFEGKIAT